METDRGASVNFIKRIVAIVLIVYFILIAFFSWKISNDMPAFNSIASDGVGYYMYLPSIFISGEFGNEPADDRIIINTSHGPLSRYSAGTAIAISPFFMMACIYYEITGEVYTGFEPGFQNAVLVSATFYFLLGLYFMGLLLTQFTLSKKIIGIALLAVAFGSNALFYSIQAPSFSHIYSFFAVTAFLWVVRRYMDTRQSKYFITASLLFGFILLLRQFNGLILLAVPFLAISINEFISFLKSVFGNVFQFITGVFLALSVAGIQQMLWYFQTGDLVLWGYGNDGFYFTRPAFFQILFSFRKGLFIYTPILFISLSGLVVLFKVNRYRFYCFIAFFFILTYLMSTWWMWYYGSSFGQRPYIEYYGLLFIPLVYLIGHISELKFKLFLIPLLITSVGFNLIQSYQYSRKILQHADMNFEKYKYVFLETGIEFENILGGNQDIIPFHKTKLTVFDLSTTFDENQVMLYTDVVSVDPQNSTNSVSDYRNREYNTLLIIPLEAQRKTRRALYAEIELEVLKMAPTNLREDAFLVVDVRDSLDETYMYYPIRIHDVPTNDIHIWHPYSYSVEIPVRKASDTMRIYVWNKYFHPLLLDNLKFKLTAFPE